jgi:energy-coupling factor transporter ATP-binding protein EcfA2
MSYAIQAESLVKRFGATTALAGVDFEVAQGTVLGLLGPNGSGKTTAVRIMATLLRPDEGRVVVGGYDAVRPGAGHGARGRRSGRASRLPLIGTAGGGEMPCQMAGRRGGARDGLPLAQAPHAMPREGRPGLTLASGPDARAGR